jgi:hypothetical protein
MLHSIGVEPQWGAEIPQLAFIQAEENKNGRKIPIDTFCEFYTVQRPFL